MTSPTRIARLYRFPVKGMTPHPVEQLSISDSGAVEGDRVLEATRERSPAHYHVALFPKPYAAYVERVTSGAVSADRVTHTVRAGESLWAIAQRYGTSVSALKTNNALRGSTIYKGQVLSVPRGH